MSLDQHNIDEQHCIWMAAGVVSYKLCDRDFECENCPFDISIRQREGAKDLPPVASNQTSSPRHSEALLFSSAENQIEHLISSYANAIAAVPFPTDRVYSSSHAWAQKVGTHELLIGLDHMGAASLSDMVSVVLPLATASLIRNSPFVWIVHREGTLSISSPVTGTVLEHNPSLAGQPNLIGTDPYGQGWIAKVRTTATRGPKPHLRSASAHAQISKKELESLQQKFHDRSKQCKLSGETLFDGGRPIQTVSELLGSSAYYEIIRDVFVGQ